MNYEEEFRREQRTNSSPTLWNIEPPKKLVFRPDWEQVFQTGTGDSGRSYVLFELKHA